VSKRSVDPAPNGQREEREKLPFNIPGLNIQNIFLAQRRNAAV
jgi:hypothetical protein